MSVGIGDQVQVVRVEDDAANRAYEGQEGTLVHVTQTYPPLCRVRFADGKVATFWESEITVTRACERKPSALRKEDMTTKAKSRKVDSNHLQRYAAHKADAAKVSKGQAAIAFAALLALGKPATLAELAARVRAGGKYPLKKSIPLEASLRYHLRTWKREKLVTVTNA